MLDTKSIGSKFKRIEKAIELQPSVARSSKKIKAVYTGGVSCKIDCGDFSISADMPQKSCGEGAAPTPGDYMGAALASCQLVTTVLWAARSDIRIDHLEVEAMIDKDSSGLFGVNEKPPRWRNIKYIVHIKSPDSKEKIMQLLQIAHEHSPMRDNLEHEFRIEREVNILT